MRLKVLLALIGTLVLSLSVSPFTGPRAQRAEEAPSARPVDFRSYHQITLIKLPNVPPQKGAFSYDISWVDPATHRYYLADRTNNAVDVIDTTTNKLVGQLAKGKFAGNTGNPDTSGPDGVLVIPGDTVAWVGDSPGLIKAVDLKSGAVVATISNGGKNRADELAYDPKDHLIVIANNADDPPFITFISTTSKKAVGKIVYSSAGGLEQPAYDPESGMFFQNVVSIKLTRSLAWLVVALSQNPGGAVDKIDPKTMKVVATYPVPECKPAGLALGPQHQLAVGCSGDVIDDGAHVQTIIIDSTDGHIVATFLATFVRRGRGFTEVGGSDEVWYNRGDNRYYIASRSMTSYGKSTPVVEVINAGTPHWRITGIPSGGNAHSVAVDPNNNHVFVPVPNGIAVFGQ